jgi:Uma2 family endonuclease
MTMTEAAFRELVLSHPDEKWELDCGVPRRKPIMTFEHDRSAEILGHFLRTQLGIRNYVVSVDAGHVRRSETRYYIPDVMVIPMEMARRLFAHPGTWHMYPDPLPLIVEVWSESTGGYDVTTKLRQYQRRGDLEIWRLHPYERTLTSWVRQADGSYSRTVHRGGVVHPAALPDVAIDLDELFSLLRPGEG